MTSNFSPVVILSIAFIIAGIVLSFHLRYGAYYTKFAAFRLLPDSIAVGKVAHMRQDGAHMGGEGAGMVCAREMA